MSRRTLVSTASTALITLILLSGTAHAQWAVTILHPAGATGSSNAYGGSGSQQVGQAAAGPGDSHAALWRGTAASWVDLHPAGAEFSTAGATNGAQQAGYAVVNSVSRASLWTGTAASWVDLHPEVTLGSRVLAMSGAQQAGRVLVNGGFRASLWSGTASSWQDLSVFLPAVFTSSQARAIWSDGANMYVTGYGFNRSARRDVALL